MEPLIKSAEEVRHLVGHILDKAHMLDYLTKGGLIDEISLHLKQIRQAHFKGELLHDGHPNWRVMFMELGILVMNLMPEFDKQSDEFSKLLKMKHDLYGPKPIRSWGCLGVIIRIDSKFERYLHLKQQRQTHPVGQPPRETEDQLLDMLGYCVLGIAYCNRLK